jgi:RHS repeat-associated protein
LPFGGELPVGVGIRSASLGYGDDSARQKFTGKVRDVETRLDYFGARYFASVQGRFISPDDFLNDTKVQDPASWNLYAYARNNPLRYIDPSGEEIYATNLTQEQRDELIRYFQEMTGIHDMYFDSNNKLVINESPGFDDDFAQYDPQLEARNFLIDAASSTTQIYNLTDVSGDEKESKEVGFAKITDGQVTGTATGDGTVKITRREYTVKIDFKDFTRVSGDKEAIAAWTPGFAVFHEIGHRHNGGLKDTPNGPNDPGPVENAIVNPIRASMGLPSRQTYLGGRVGNDVQLWFKYPSGKEKVLRWKDDQVGGTTKK